MTRKQIKERLISILEDDHLDEDHGLELDPNDIDSMLEYVQDLLDVVNRIVIREIEDGQT